MSYKSAKRRFDRKATERAVSYKRRERRERAAARLADRVVNIAGMI